MSQALGEGRVVAILCHACLCLHQNTVSWAEGQRVRGSEACLSMAVNVLCGLGGG